MNLLFRCLPRLRIRNGYGELRLSDLDGIKRAWYLYSNLEKTGKSFGETWEEVHNKLLIFLREQAYQIKKQAIL